MPFERLDDPKLGCDPGRDVEARRRGDLVDRESVSRVQHRQVKTVPFDLDRHDTESLCKRGRYPRENFRAHESNRIVRSERHPIDLGESLAQRGFIDEAQIDQMASEIPAAELLRAQGFAPLGGCDLARADQNLADLLRHMSSEIRWSSVVPSSRLCG